MSRTIHSSKGPGYDWWSRRPYSGDHGSGSAPYMHWIKRRLHKTERRQAEPRCTLTGVAACSVFGCQLPSNCTLHDELIGQEA